MSPKTKEQFEEIRHRSKETIKQTAMELFAHRGYHSTSISKIAEEAGISKGLMYNYFASKEALLGEIIMEAVHIGQYLLNQSLEASDDPYEQLEILTNNSINWIKSNEHYWKLLTSLAFQPDVQKMMLPIMKEHETAAIQKTLPIFEKMGLERPLQELMLYSATMDGVMIQYLQIGDEYPLEDMKNMILERYKRP
ncbi:MAG: TetR/AcrR family transcriptional regulator [Saprospiraceae bacterium]|nr:TetR/AcrR family transcriptional regulator [Saprospiraceae bacterium]